MVQELNCASILRVALDYDYYHEQGHEDGLILRTLKSRADSYDEKVVDTLSQILDTDADIIPCRKLIHEIYLKE